MNELARLSVDQRDEMDNDALRSLLESEAANLRVQQLRLEVASTKRAARWAELESEQHIATRAMESVFDGFSAQVVDHMQRYLERREFQGRGLNGGWPTDPEDTKDGHFKPFWQTLAEYRELMGIIRDLVQIHEQCETITQKIVDYVVHTGFTHKIEPVDLDEDKELVKAAQKILDEFHDRTNWIVEREGNFVGETIQYGEQLVWLRHDGDGKTSMVDVPLEQISEPLPRYQGQLEEIYDLPAASWTYGVVTDLQDTSKILGFFWDRDHTGANYDFIPADEAMWIKVNTPDQVKRGRTDFYPLLEMFGITKPIIRNVGWQTAIQASIAYIRKQTIGSTGGGHITPLGPSGAPITRRTRGGDNLMGEVHRPGSIHDTNGVEYEAGPMGNNQADSYVAVYEAILRIMGQRWEMPEFLISGVADTANKSTTEDSVEPWYRRVERTQVFFAHHFQRADRRVLSIAIEAGRLAEFGMSSMEEFDERLTLAVKGAPTKRSRPEDEIDGDVALVEAKVMSRQTLREKHNLNHEREERRIEQEMQQDLQRQEQQMELKNRMNPQEPGGFGARESVLEHLGPGNHPSGSPQTVHGVKGGEAKWQAAQPKKGGKKNRRQLLQEISDKARAGIAGKTGNNDFEEAAIRQINAVLEFVPTDTLARVSEVTNWSLHGTREAMIDEASDWLDTSSAGFGGMVLSNDEDSTPGKGGTIILDGDAVGSHDSYGFQHIYAHEIGHAVEFALPGIDGQLPADSDEWVDAWTHELADGQLTDYAATEPAEGWAELFAVAANGSYDVAAERFPRATAALVRLGALKPNSTRESVRHSSRENTDEFRDVLAPISCTRGRADAWKAEPKTESGRSTGENQSEAERLTEAAALIWADYPGGKPGE